MLAIREHNERSPSGSGADGGSQRLIEIGDGFMGVLILSELEDNIGTIDEVIVFGVLIGENEFKIGEIGIERGLVILGL